VNWLLQCPASIVRFDGGAHGAYKVAAEDPAITRIFVNAAIKKEMCSEAGTDRAWLRQGPAMVGHASTFHVRLGCPPDSPQCKPQPPVLAGDGCGHELDFWFKDSTLHPKPPPPRRPETRMTLKALPQPARAVVKAP